MKNTPNITGILNIPTLRFIILENTGITEIHESMSNIQRVELYDNANLVNWDQIFASMNAAVKIIKLQNNPELHTIAQVHFERFNELTTLEIYLCKNLQGEIPMSITEIPTLTRLRLVKNNFNFLESEPFFLQLANLDKIRHGDFAMYQEGNEGELQYMITQAHNGLSADKKSILEILFFNDLARIWGTRLPANVESWDLIAHHAQKALDNENDVL